MVRSKRPNLLPTLEANFSGAYKLDVPGGGGRYTHAGADNVQDALRQIAEWFPGAKLLSGTIIVESPELDDQLDLLVYQVWCDSFPQSEEEEAPLKDCHAALFKSLRPLLDRGAEAAEEAGHPLKHRNAALFKLLRPLLDGGAHGIKRWNEIQGRRSVKWNNTDLSNAYLKGAQLNGLDWRDSKFDKAMMEHCDFERANLANVSFNGANLSKANLRDCRAKNASFAKAKMTGANLSNANLSQTDFSNCDLKKAWCCAPRGDILKCPQPYACGKPG